MARSAELQIGQHVYQVEQEAPNGDGIRWSPNQNQARLMHKCKE